MLTFAQELLEALTKYFIYLYPGFISLGIYRFLKGLNFRETKESVIKSIVISFIYVQMLLPLFDFILNITVNKLFPNLNARATYAPDAILLVVSLVFPYIFWKLQDAKWVKRVLQKLGIFTNVHDNPLDIVTSYENGAWISAFMDDYGVMYEGALRNYDSDLKSAEYLMISDYRVSKLDKNTNTYIQTFPPLESEQEQSKKERGKKNKKSKQEVSNESQNLLQQNDGTGTPGKSKEWVVLSRSKITRLEVLFENEH